MAESEVVMYSEEYQVKVLAYMLQNPNFTLIAKEAIDREHFANRALQWYFDALSNAPVPLSPATLKEELLKAVGRKLIKEHEIDKVAGYYDFVKVPVLPFEEEHIQTTFGKFVRRQAMKQAVLDSLDLIKSDDDEKIDEALANIEAARNKGLDILTIGHRFFADFEQRLANRMARDEIRRLSTGIPELDAMMYGGLKNKQMGLVVGGSGRGKSIFLEWLARVAVVLGQQVVYYTLELSEEDISERFDSLFCHIKPQELKSLNGKVYEELHKYHDRFGNNLIVKEYPEDEASINTIKAHYKQMASIGVQPGLVIIDYLDLMKPHRHYHDINQEQASIAKACRGMSKKFNTRVWSALQLNRGGMVQETPDESGLAGSISRMYTADALIIMAQNKEEREDNIMRLFIKKNRNGPSERTIKIATDFEHMTFYAGSVNETALTSGQASAKPQDWTDTDAGTELTPDEVGEVGGAVTLD
jgi:replicative DNA helicase